MGAGGAKATVMSDSVLSRVPYVNAAGGIDIRRGLDEASCNFLEDSVSVISSFDRRGIRDVLVEPGEDGGDGSWIVFDRREDC